MGLLKKPSVIMKKGWWPCVIRKKKTLASSDLTTYVLEQSVSFSPNHTFIKKKYISNIFSIFSFFLYSINCMALSEDSSMLVTGSEDSTARMWSTKTDDTECIGVLR